MGTKRRIQSAAKTVKRAAELTRLARAGAKLRRARDPEARARAERALVSMLADARGLPMKIGQFLAGSDEAFRPLTDSAPALPVDEIRHSVESSLGAKLEDVFRHFDEASAAASIGQVHRAIRADDGREVAVKVRYPGIEDDARAEMSIAGLLPGVGPVKRFGFDLSGYKQLIAEDLERELDYLHEAESQARFAEGITVSGLRVASVHADLTREDLLVTDWLPGKPIESAASLPADVRREIARILVDTFLVSIFELGEIHADPHFGNLALRPGPEVALYDFGCTAAIEEPRRRALLKVILACREQTDVCPIDAFCALGFDPGKLAFVAPALPAMTRILFEPFASDRPMNPGTWSLGRRLDNLLGDRKWWFRAAGPPDLLLVIRAIHGLFEQLRALKIAVPFGPRLDVALAPATLSRAREEPLPTAPESLRTTRRGLAGAASELRVEVLEHGAPKVRVAMPAEASLDLAAIVPEELHESIRKSGHDLEQIETGIRESGLAPQEILTHQEGAKTYRVWLE